MKKFIFCGLLMTSLFGFGQSVNITDPETLISYRTRYITTEDGKDGYILENIIPTPRQVIEASATGELSAPIKIIRGPRVTGNITLPNGQDVWAKVCGKTDDTWCGLEWVGFNQ